MFRQERVDVGLESSDDVGICRFPNCLQESDTLGPFIVHKTLFGLKAKLEDERQAEIRRRRHPATQGP